MRKTLLGIALGCLTLLANSLPANSREREDNWSEEDYRSITAMPPTLSIEGNVLNIYFIDALTNLQIQIQDSFGFVQYEETMNGKMGETYFISLEGLEPGIYQIVLTHKLGWIKDEFTIQ